jgi:hypothetical protein
MAIDLLVLFPGSAVLCSGRCALGINAITVADRIDHGSTGAFYLPPGDRGGIHFQIVDFVLAIAAAL